MARIQRTNSPDWAIIGIYFGLLVIGWMMLYAASYQPDSQQTIFDFSTVIGKQSLWMFVSVIAFGCCLAIDWRFWNTFSYPIYGACLLLLVLVLLLGVEIKGATSWFRLFGFTIQPSEFAKLGTALGVSSYLSHYKSDLKSRNTLLIASGLVLLPAILILLQPDAGSAMVFASFLVLFYRNGLSSSFYIVIGILIAILILSLIYHPILVCFLILSISLLFIANRLIEDRPLLLGAYLAIPIAMVSLYNYWNGLYTVLAGTVVALSLSVFLFFKRSRETVIRLIAILLMCAIVSFSSKFAFDHILKPHQQERINVWLSPEKCDPRGSLYNILQSKMAIGSGGITGKGFLDGTLTKLNYVPEQTTDFIFSTIGEEQGFLGSLGVILLFSFLLVRLTIMAERGKSKFITNFCYCVAGLFFIHFFINIGMTMGIMPVIGIPLPFLSKGGSSLLVFSILLGIVLRMDMARNLR